MNEEMLKNVLLEIIREADNLPESELEVIPGTRIRVKKGRVDEFKANARFYYSSKNNIIINNDDYIKEVYYELSDELARVEGEHILSKAYELHSMNKTELERIDALNKSLAINASDREKQRKILDDLNSRNVSDPKTWEEITNLQNSLKTLSDNEIIIRNAIAEVKDKVNNEIKSVVEDEMAYLKESYLNTNAGTSIGFGLDGASILAKDKENYDNLYILLKIIENVNEKDRIVSVDNTICVNPHQVDAVKELLPKIKLLSLVKEEVKSAPAKEKPNDKIIATISEELTRLDEIIAKEDLASAKIEKENLLEILKILNRANNTEFALTPVWDAFYVNGIDREPFITLLKKTELFKGYNPDIEKTKENEELIAKLKAYLASLEDKVKNYQGLNNIPVVRVGNAVILPEDKEEYENVASIISILENSHENLIHISDGGNVNHELYPKYKELIAKTKYFTPNIMTKRVEEQNGPLIKEVEEELKDLIKKAKTTPNAVLAEGKEILASDLEKYNLLNKKYVILKSANPSGDLVEVDTALINREQETEYKDVIANLAKLHQKKEDTLDPAIIQKIGDEISEASKRITHLMVRPQHTSGSPVVAVDGGKVLEEDLEEYNALKAKISILAEVNNTNPKDLVEVNGTFVPASRAEEYKEILDKLAKIAQKGKEPAAPSGKTSTSEEEKDKKKPKRSLVKSIRKCKPEVSDWWKKNWKNVALIGLSATAVALTLTSLAPAIVYANSCLAMANPALASMLGGINSTIINTLGLTLGELNLNVAAGSAFTALTTALAKVGIIGIGTVGVVKGLRGLNSPEENRLPDPNRKTFAENITKLGKQLVEKSKELSKTLANKASEFTENLAYATNADNVKLEQEVMNAKMNFDANIKDASFEEIDENVQKQLEEEKRAIIEERINERFNRIKHADDAEYLRPTTLSDEPIIKGSIPDASPVTVTIPTDEEILGSISDKSVQIARVDNYIDALKVGDTSKASEYQKLVFDETGIDLSKYDMNNYEELVQARSDVADFMNQIHTTKRSR